MKLVAYFSGPEGVGKLGQVLSLISLLAVFAGGGIGNGIAKYIAEFRASPARLRQFLGSATCFTVASTGLITIAGVYLSDRISLQVLQDQRFQYIVVILAVVQPFIAANNFLIAVLTGFGDVTRVSVSYILSALILALLTAALSAAFALDGALLSLILSQAITCIVTAALLLRSPHVGLLSFPLKTNRQMVSKLLQYSLISLSSAVLPLIANMWIRSYLAARFSWTEVGYWQAVTKISEAYLLFFTVPLATYYLPRVSAIREYRLFKREIMTTSLHLLPQVIVAAVVVYVLRDLVLRLLFSPDFSPAEQLFLPQLLGDVIKVTSYLLSYVMMARAMTASLIVSEVLFNVSYVALVVLFSSRFGLIGAIYAFSANYCVYLICVSYLTWRFVRTATWTDSAPAPERLPERARQ